MKTMELNWVCVHTKPWKEKAVSQYCHTIFDTETYLPFLRYRKTIRRVRREVVEPLFPRYFFVRLNLASHYRAIRYAPDVNSIVSFGGRPALVPDSLLEDLKSWAADTLDLCTPRREIKVGDHVEICEGPMTGLNAVVLREMNCHERVSVLLTSIESNARLNISRDSLELVG